MHFARSILLFTFVNLLVASANAQSATCETLFRTTEVASGLIHPSWQVVLEHDYDKMKRELGAVGNPIPAFGVGKLLYQHWQLGHESDAMLFKIGFKTAEPSTTNPLEVARFVFPSTHAELIQAIEVQQGARPTFKLATYGGSRWVRLNETMTYGVKIEPESDLAFLEYAKLVAAGYTPLWPTSRTMGFLHDLSHVTEYLEYPDVFPALQTFFGRFVAEGWQTKPYYRQRGESFNEFSYVLKPSRYGSIDFVLVSGLTAEVSVAERATAIRGDLLRDPAYAIEMTKRLTESFNDIFERHGGGARDFFNVDNYMMSTEIVKKYVTVMKANPADGIFVDAIERTSRIEPIESLEGINRQIVFVLNELSKKPDAQLIEYLAYRVAQLEAAMIAQKSLSLSQSDIIRDSMQPLGVDTKTRRYFKSFQPPGSHHYAAFVGLDLRRQ